MTSRKELDRRRVMRAMQRIVDAAEKRKAQANQGDTKDVRNEAR